MYYGFKFVLLRMRFEYRARDHDVIVVAFYVQATPKCCGLLVKLGESLLDERSLENPVNSVVV